MGSAEDGIHAAFFYGELSFVYIPIDVSALMS